MTIAPADDKQTVSSQLRGETMAYAVQSGFWNIGANIFEPYFSKKYQEYEARHDPTHHLRAGSYSQNLTGELAGDLIGCGTLLLAEAVAPEQLHSFTRAAREVVDPVYDALARKVFAGREQEPGYTQNVEKWKTFQERNLVRSGIMAAAGIAGNVATQKLLVGSPAPATLILKGKLLSTGITTALGLGARFAFPQQMRGIDRWLGQNLFAPLMEDKEIPAEPEVPSPRVMPGAKLRYCYAAASPNACTPWAMARA